MRPVEMIYFLQKKEAVDYGQYTVDSDLDGIVRGGVLASNTSGSLA